MTIFRCNLVDLSKLTFQFVSANEPDLIGVEVRLDGNCLIDLSMDRDGLTSVLFDQDAGQMEFDLADLQSLLERCESDLREWRERLIVPGEIWSATE